MGIYINHRFTRKHPVGLDGLELMRETATQGPFKGLDVVVRLHVAAGSERTFLQWVAIFPTVAIYMPDGERLNLPGNYGIITCQTSDLIAAAISRVAGELAEVWWSDEVGSGDVRLWQAGRLVWETQDEAHQHAQFDQALHTCFGVPNAAVLARLWDALVATDRPPTSGPVVVDRQ